MTSPNDPRNEFYTGDYSKQKQPYPGVQKEMEQIPDCGEETYKGNGRLSGRKALVTGGDSGIGRAAAIAYAKEGADVAINYMEEEQSDAEEVKKVIEEAGQKAYLFPGDLREEEFARQLIHDAKDALGGLDILVLNASMQQAVEKFADYTAEHLETTYKINIVAPVLQMQEAEKIMPEGSSIIITTSIQSFSPSAHIADYAMTKAAQTNLIKSQAQHFMDKGIRLNGVAPGPIWTPIQISGGQLQEMLPEFGKDSYVGRAAQPVELAGTYVHLASGESSYTTGQVYGVTGGAPIN